MNAEGKAPVTVMEQGEADGAFTEFARTRLLYESGYVRDTTRRVYVMGGRTDTGSRIRREVNATLLLVWHEYVTEHDMNLLWVKWSDGRRHLVHRKGTSFRQEN